MLNIDVQVPTCWQELTQSQLRYVYFLMSQNYTSDEVKTFYFCRFGGLKVLQRTDNGYLHTQNADLLTDIARQLYHAPTLTLSKEESASIFYWFASLKAYYQRRFSYLFSTEPTQGDNLQTPMQTTEQRQQTAMDNQIRALTKGNVTKETEEDLLQHRTDGTDAFDTLYIVCSKFPQSHISPIVVSGVQ